MFNEYVKGFNNDDSTCNGNQLSLVKGKYTYIPIHRYTYTHIPTYIKIHIYTHLDEHLLYSHQNF